MNTTSEIEARALELPPAERACLAQKLLLSLESLDADFESAWAEEIASRLEKLDQGQTTARDWRGAVEGMRQALREKDDDPPDP